MSLIYSSRSVQRLSTDDLRRLSANGPSRSRSIYKNPTINRGLQNVFLCVDNADVYFEFGRHSDERIPAHKCLLSAESDVFKSTFVNGDLAPTIVQIDAPVAAFKEFLQFFYFSEVILSMEHIVNVINLAKMYDVIACLNVCLRYLKDILTSDTLIFVYGVAIYFELDALKTICETRISIKPEAFFSTSAFLKCHRSVLSHILSLDTLSCSEMLVFEACVAWATATSAEKNVNNRAIRARLDDLFYDIRFGSMTIEDFVAMSASNNDLFSPDEYKEIVQLIVCKEFQSTKFKRNARQIQSGISVDWNKECVIECNRLLADLNPIASYHIIQAVETTTFSTNVPIILGEFRCAELLARETGNKNVLATEVKITEIFDNIDRKIIRFGKGTFANEVISLRPVLIQPGFTYEIEFKQNPNTHLFRANELKAEVRMDEDIFIEFSGTTNGFITALAFNRIVNA